MPTGGFSLCLCSVSWPLGEEGRFCRVTVSFTPSFIHPPSSSKTLPGTGGLGGSVEQHQEGLVLVLGSLWTTGTLLWLDTDGSGWPALCPLGRLEKEGGFSRRGELRGKESGLGGARPLEE